MKKILEKVNKDKVVSLYNDKSDTEGFYSGKIVGIDDECVLLAHYNQIGEYSGYVILKTENVFRIFQGSKYEKKIDKLSERYEKRHTLEVNDSRDLMKLLLEYAKQRKHVVLIELCESNLDDIQGVVSFFDEDILTVNCVDEYGIDDGISTFYLNDITVIKCDTDACQEVAILME